MIQPPQFSLRDIDGLIETVSAVPSHIPKTFWDQFKIYTSGATYRLYYYDVNNATWHYITASA